MHILYLEIGSLYFAALALNTELVPSGAGAASTAGASSTASTASASGITATISSSPAGSGSLEETGTLAAR